MKILFVRPKPSGETIGLQHIMVVEPLELEILATLVRNEHEVRIVDLILEKNHLLHFLNEFQPEVLCLTGYITHIPIITEYCTIAKQFNKKIITVVGGVHTEKFPGDIDNINIDYRVVRNATRTFPQLIKFIEGKSDFPNGVLKIHQICNEEDLPDFDFYVPIPDRSLTSKYRNKYFYVFHNKVALIKTSFGCPFKCKFCFCRAITCDKYHARPLSEVIEELLSIKEKEIYIIDDDFLISKNRVSEFIDLIKKHNIRKKYLIYGRADFIAENSKLIKEFRDVGLRTIIVGLESFADVELREFHKQTTSNINKAAMNVLNKHGVDCYAAVILSPDWSRDDFKKAYSEMKDLGIKFINLQPLTPLKGTGLEINEDDLVIKRNEYPKWDLAHVTIRPENLTLSEYYNNIYKLYLDIILRPKNIFTNFKYPPHMQLKLLKGMYRVRKQYCNKIIEYSENA